jgi:hypothetical protein
MKYAGDESKLSSKTTLTVRAVNPLVISRETREGLPLQTVETEANGDSRITYEIFPSLAGFLGSPAGTKEFCPALTALVGPVRNI